MNYTLKGKGWGYRVKRCSYCSHPAMMSIGSENYCNFHAIEVDGPRWRREAEDAWIELRRIAGVRYADDWHSRTWPEDDYKADTWRDIAHKIQAQVNKLAQSYIIHVNPRIPR